MEVARPANEIQTKQTMEPLKKVFAMAKGDGEHSYSKNSRPQALANDCRQSALTESLEKVSLPSKESRVPVVISDLGCSSSSNAITNVALIIDKLRLRLPNDAEFQAYFNDLPSNDFNLLFQLLNVEDGAKNFYAAGVPGSFYDRLFPRSQVHVFHSSLCLHWMSKVPEALLDKESPAYNGGSVWLMNSRPAAVEAYKQQSLLDLKAFLRAREAELQPGGLLFVSMMGRPDSAQIGPSDRDVMGVFLSDLDNIFNDLISEGLLSKEQHDSFNVPYYLRSVEEVKGVLEDFGDAFRVLGITVQDVGRTVDELFPGVPDEEVSIKRAHIFRAGVETLLESFFPKTVVDIFWQRLERNDQKRLGANRDRKTNATMCVMSLIKT